jgi:sec-independent protein translocase protein TatB
MFDFGFWELVVVGVVALLVVGPDRLPGLARQLGTWVGNTKRFVSSVRADIERELQSEELRRMLDEQRNEIRQLKGMISETQAEVKEGLRETGTGAVEGQVPSEVRDPRAEDSRTDSDSKAIPRPASKTSNHGATRPTGS